MTYRPRNAVALCLDFDYSAGEWFPLEEEKPRRCSYCEEIIYPDDEVDADGMCVVCAARFAVIEMDHGRVAQEGIER